MARERKKKVKTIFLSIGAALLGLVTILASIAFVIPSFWYSIYYSQTNINLTNWMSELDDEIKINKIVMPGSHDSSTEYCDLPLFTRTQQYSIKEQLNKGVRLFDMRYAIEKNRIKLCHSSFTCKKDMINTLFLDKVLNDVYKFLDDNQSETVVFVAKKELAKDTDTELATIFDGLIEGKQSYWYTNNTIPQLKDCRGKIVLLTRYYDNFGSYVEWADQGNPYTEGEQAYAVKNYDNYSVIVQDRYKYNIKNKWDAFLADVPEADKEAYVLDYLSTTTESLSSPFTPAKPLNKKFMELSKKDAPKYWLFFDFISEGMVERVIQLNNDEPDFIEIL